MIKDDLLESRYGAYIKDIAYALDTAYEMHDNDAIKHNMAKWNAIRESLRFILGREYYFMRTTKAYMICSVGGKKVTDYLVYEKRR